MVPLWKGVFIESKVFGFTWWLTRRIYLRVNGVKDIFLSFIIWNTRSRGWLRIFIDQIGKHVAPGLQMEKWSFKVLGEEEEELTSEMIFVDPPLFWYRFNDSLLCLVGRPLLVHGHCIVIIGQFPLLNYNSGNIDPTWNWSLIFSNDFKWLEKIRWNFNIEWSLSWTKLLY